MNTQASATGMEVRAIAGSSLQISKSVDFETGITSVAFEGKYILEPSVEYVSQTGEAGATLSPTKKLVTVANGKDVDPNTGLAKAEKTLVYKEADTEASTTVKGYYIDYVLYLAAEGTDEDLTQGILKITVAKPASFSEYALNAVSIMVLDKNENKLGDTILLRDGVSKQQVIVLSDTNKIPAAVAGTRTETGALKLILRVFIDGSLEDEAGVSTYVRNTKIVNLDNSVNFGVVFDLENE